MQFVETFQSNRDAAKTTQAALHEKAMAPAGYKPEEAANWKMISQRVAAELKRVSVRENRYRRKASFQMKVPKEKKEKLIAFDEAIITECFRQMTANEAAWILLCLPIAKQSHTVSLII